MNHEFEELKRLLKDDAWPKAVDRCINLNIEKEKENRATNILNIFDIDLKGKRFLDFGCGEGHVVLKAKPLSSLSVGFDLFEKGDLWTRNDNLTLDWKKIKDSGPYDIILIHDVVDHIIGDYNDVFENIKDVSNGLVCIRCHPFCGRHGFHMHHQINKAFIQMVFTEQELTLLGLYQEEKTAPIIFPTQFYSFFSKYFEVLEFRITRDPVEDFFKNELVENRIKLWYGDDLKFHEHMSCSFVDFILCNKS